MVFVHTPSCSCDNPGDRVSCACCEGLTSTPFGAEEGLRSCGFVVPEGCFCVDPDALRRARSEVPDGEFHINFQQ